MPLLYAVRTVREEGRQWLKQLITLRNNCVPFWFSVVLSCATIELDLSHRQAA